jgi:hypothetical protein
MASKSMPAAERRHCQRLSIQALAFGCFGHQRHPARRSGRLRQVDLEDDSCRGTSIIEGVKIADLHGRL